MKKTRVYAFEIEIKVDVGLELLKSRYIWRRNPATLFSSQ